MMIPDGFVIPVGYSQADSNSCVDPCRVFHCKGNCFAFLTVFWKPTGTKQTDRNLPVSGSDYSLSMYMNNSDWFHSI